MDSTSTLESDKGSSLANLRRDYQLASLDESQVASDPILQFNRWLQEAQQANLLEPNAMTLAIGTDCAVKGLRRDRFLFLHQLLKSQRGGVARSAASLLGVSLERA
jgi:pyridoxine/pyridoxamine 5'-phosphate oxidase